MNQAPRYLKTVRIRNFQSHRDTEVHLQPGINLIVGTNDVGKSAFMRAINLVMHNEVPNREFVTYGESNATVILEFSDGTIVERIKGSTKNACYVTLPNGDELPFDKMGNKEMPAEVLKALGNPPIDKRHGPLAYADQLSPMFLVSLTPTELPRAISELIGLDDYEIASQNLAKKARQFDRQIKEGKERITNAEAEFENYNGLDAEIESYDKIHEKLLAAEELRNQINETESELETYQEILTQGKTTLVELNKAKKLLVLQEPIVECKSIADKITDLEDCLENYNDVTEQINQLQASLKTAQAITTSNLNDLLVECKTLLDNITDADEFLSEYQVIMSEGKKTKTELEAAQLIFEEAQNTHQAFVKELQDKGMICPECDQLVGSI